MELIERLEARQMLSASVWQVVGADNPANPSDTIVIEAVPEKTGWLRAEINGADVSYRRASQITSIRINAGDGNDLVHVRLGHRFGQLGTLILGGNGHDVLIGGAGPDTISGGSGADRLDGRANVNVVDGGSGVDEIHWQRQDKARSAARDIYVGQIRPRMIAPVASAPADDPQYDPFPWQKLPDPQPLDDSPADSVSGAISK